MSKFSNYFCRSEFACKCGQCMQDTIDAELLMVLEDVRKHFSQPVIIKSAHRCWVHNLIVGGVKSSMHLIGKAADIVVENIKPSQVAEYLENEYMDRYGIGRYDDFVHIDVRSTPARWSG